MTEERETLHTSDFAERGETGEARSEDEPISRDARGEGTPDASASTRAGAEAAPPLLPPEESGRFRERWQEIQTAFVDEPRAVVEQADALVAELMQELARSFSEAREGLESQWASGDDVSTEDLRQALTRYRSFFQRLLSA